jgi:uncharacterized membrane protein
MPHPTTLVAATLAIVLVTVVLVFIGAVIVLSRKRKDSER